MGQVREGAGYDSRVEAHAPQYPPWPHGSSTRSASLSKQITQVWFFSVGDGGATDSSSELLSACAKGVTDTIGLHCNGAYISHAMWHWSSSHAVSRIAMLLWYALIHRMLGFLRPVGSSDSHVAFFHLDAEN